MNREELIRVIASAFDGVPQPSEITLHVAEAHDEYDYDHDAEHRRKDYIGRWQDIPSAHIQKCQTALSYVDKVGMRFYLPAYMIWYVKNLGSGQVWTDHALYSLDNHPNDPRLSEYQKERFSLFSKEQLQACALFIRYCASDTSGYGDPYFAQAIYKRHWSQHEHI